MYNTHRGIIRKVQLYLLF